MISFNNVPTNLRTPGVFGEVDASKAVSGLAAIPHKVLIIGQKLASGTVPYDTVVALSRTGLADGFFGLGSEEARMANVFKENNNNTEVFGIVIGSGIAGAGAETTLDFSAQLSNIFSGAETMHIMFNGTNIDFNITSGMSGGQVASLVASTINSPTYTGLPMRAAMSAVAGSMGNLTFSALQSGTLGNDLDIRHNYFVGQSFPVGFSGDLSTPVFSGGSVDPDLEDVWAVIGGDRYNYIIQPWKDTPNLLSLETEMARRFLPLNDLQGHAFTGSRSTLSAASTLGNSRNSPHNTIMPAFDSPTDPIEWGAALGAQAAAKLNADPARPLHFLKLTGILPPPKENRFIQSEQNILLFDGMATWIVDSGGNVLIERCITTYQTNALGTPDPTFLDVQTLATLGELRDQYKIRMQNRFIIPRFKLADDGNPIPPGAPIATPSTIKQETIALFTQLGPSGAGLIENLEEFIAALIVERDLTDRNRVNSLLAPDLINQFRVLAGLFQFIL